MLGKVSRCQDPPKGPPTPMVGGIFLIHYILFFLTFEYPELSLECSMLTVCTRGIKLVVMVASPHLSYVDFIFLFSSSKAYWPCSRPSCGCWERGFGAKTLARALQH